MRRKYLFLFIIITLVFEIFFTIQYMKEDELAKNNIIEINELVKEVEKNYEDTSKYPRFFEYTVLDENQNVNYKTANNLSETLNEAYKNKDTILDFSYGNNQKGKILIHNNFNEIINLHQKEYITIIILIGCIQLVGFSIYYIYLYKSILYPFKKMNHFATRIAEGNLDIPLYMDKQNNFGAFTEAFDVMRTEIIKSREAEKKAIEAKKELVAKLSHDIKTPISSIKSYSELGVEISNEEKSKEYFRAINHKSDQMSMLITNLFNSTLEELEELSIYPTEISTNIIENLIESADYLDKNKAYTIPKCTVYADKLRLQQVFDNIFVNSYKYANTQIETKSYIDNEYLVISIRDFGNSFEEDELPLLTEKFKRGQNTQGIEGTGLGLYITKEFLRKMNGDLEIENGKPGFIVRVYLRII